MRWINSQAIILLTLVLALPSNSRAENWPGWRGPTGLGYTSEKDLPLTWDGKTGKNILWKTPIHGGGKNNPEFATPGWSSPIVWGDRIFVTTATFPAGLAEKERRSSIAQHHILCFDAKDGKQLWDTEIPAGKIVVDNFYHGYAVPTPVTDGKMVFGLFGSGVLAAVTFQGDIVWREELPRLKDSDAGVCSSPILYEDTIIIPGLQELGLRALEKKTGKLKWEQQTKARNTMSTPVVLQIRDKLQLIHFAGGIQSLNPATGELLWNCKTPTAQSSPAFGGGLIYADVGRGGQQGAAVDPTGTGDVSKTHVKWQTRIEGAAGSSAIVVGTQIYRGSSSDLLRSLSLATGELLFEEKLAKLSPSSSPIATPEGRIYFASSGRTYVIQAGPKYEFLAVNDLGDGPDYASAAVSEGRIYIKGKSYLWCIGTK